MANEKSERICKLSLERLNVWFMKIQNIHVTTTPSDFIVLGTGRYLIEVKEIKLFKGYNSFSFDRLTQEKALIDFVAKNNELNSSYILINFRERTLKNSHIFLLSIADYLTLKFQVGKKSANLNDFNKYVSHAKLNPVPGSAVDLSQHIV